LEVKEWPVSPSRGCLLLIHEALGSVSYWKDFPEKLAAATQFRVLAYSRAGHGKSEGPVEARSLDYYRDQIETVIPAVLAHFGVERPVLYGHSEGAAIALLYAGRSGASDTVKALIAECPFVTPEERTAETVRSLAGSYTTSDLQQRLGRYHHDADAVFQAWIRSDRGAVFQDFSMRESLAHVACPVLVLQGSRDDFGSVAQFEAVRQSIPSAQHQVLEAGHLLHREMADVVVESVTRFLDAVHRGH